MTWILSPPILNLWKGVGINWSAECSFFFYACTGLHDERRGEPGKYMKALSKGWKMIDFDILIMFNFIQRSIQLYGECTVEVN